MNSLRVDWEMYAIPVLSLCAIVLLLIVANFFAERAFKSQPEFRRRTYFWLKSVGLAYLASMILAVFIGSLYAGLCFPLFLLIAFFVLRRRPGTAALKE